MVVEQKTVSAGLGGLGDGTTLRTMIVAGDRSRSEDEFTYTGRFTTLAGGGKRGTTIAITRVDREVLWNLDPERKQYTEGGLLGRKLAGAAQRKAGDKAEERSGETVSRDSGAAGGPLMKVVTAVVSITTTPAPAGSFDIPAGYRLQKTE